MDRRNVVLLIIATVVATTFALLTVATMGAMLFGFSFGGFVGGEPAESPTPTKTLVPTWTATPTIVPSPTDTPTPTMPPETPTPTMPPETPTPTQLPTSTPAPPANTPTPRPPAPTPTPKPPSPTNTPQPTHEYDIAQEPHKDFCHAGFCLPEIRGDVIDAAGNPVPRYSVWIKLESAFGAEYCAVGDENKMLQPGQFKFESHGGQWFGDYRLTVVRSQGDPTPLSPPLQNRMASAKSQHTGIVFRRKY